ncbi:DUF4382 domain-containing protein [Antarcticibacterium sp. 1MA-6-2]|uniref:DUF4382 domain-containing protein n=1 Tax=Antarcticibacterium sp. 1MA-6-2 TaxID=2908210 RepID=UPI001F45E482|nr:DUF4382 domain-containing protein [Antarcticibacterium sp. 1MA-6-2]UJH90260.1 DUF4382 domain-containing protein [Antarcticibacterium sp. 1MA-6-2]
MKMFSGKLKLRKFAGLLLAVVALTSFASCSDDDDKMNEDTARLMIRLTDAPGDFESVLIEVKDVRIKRDASAGEEEGWVSLPGVKTGIYDLLELTGGITELLADAEVPAGPLTQIRLVLGENNTVVIDGESQALSTPSAQQSGLKLQVNETLEAGEEYEFLLDFNVDQSIVSAGSAGGYSLKPVIRVTTMEATGTIMGEIQPSLTQSVVKAKNATNEISAYTDANGTFSLNGVPAGTYQITVTPDATTGYEAKTLNNIVVTSGQTTDLETIFFE